MILIVGEAPGRRGSRNLVDMLYEKTGVRLRNATYRNLLNVWPGSLGKGSGFPVERARDRARRFRIRSHVTTVVIFGKRLAQAFDLSADYFEPVGRNGRRWIVVPHPSGVNAWWNDWVNCAQARVFLEGLN
ncbi:MAG: hypothetical protein V3T08_10005 [Gemmatimonadota bacterium]